MSEYAIWVDWSEQNEKWDNIGRSILDERCQHKTQDHGENKETNLRYSGYCDECDISEDSGNPMIKHPQVKTCGI
jgi:heat shock protein HspQ